VMNPSKAAGHLQESCFLRGMSGAFGCGVEAAGPPGYQPSNQPG
jgi:hypothetical protein